MTTKVKGTEGIEFPDATVQASAAYSKAEADAAFAPKAYQSREIIQQLFQTDAGTSTTSSSLTNLTNSLISFTPKSTNSTILVEVVFNGGVANGAGINSQAVYNLFETNVAGAFGINAVVGALAAAGGVGVQTVMVLKYYRTNNALTTRSFGLCGALNVGSGLVVYGSSQSWTITEIQN